MMAHGTHTATPLVVIFPYLVNVESVHQTAQVCAGEVHPKCSQDLSESLFGYHPGVGGIFALQFRSNPQFGNPS